MALLALILASATPIRALISVKDTHNQSSCVTLDLKHRAAVQNKLAGACVEMCKEVGAYPKCSECVGFVEPDSTPNVMTWEELLEHMDNLVVWGRGEIKSWHKRAVFAEVNKIIDVDTGCAAMDMKNRMRLQSKLAGVCVDMCKEVGAYPKCSQCAGFVAPDSTPNVMTWEELLSHMDNLVEWGRGEIKSWHKRAAQLQIAVHHENEDSEQACLAEDLKHRVVVQNKLAGDCDAMCRDLGAYPKCPQCPGFVAPDSTPGVMTWDELLLHLDNLVEWGGGEIKAWKHRASALQMSGTFELTNFKGTACQANDLKHRALFQNKLAGDCEDMCKELGAYPRCSRCAKFVKPDDTPGVVTWDELLTDMDNLVAWGKDTIKGWTKRAAALQIARPRK